MLRMPALLAYALLAVPLAFVALPIYVHVPQLYSLAYGMPLAQLGSILLIARLWDALIDPLIGVLGDRWPQRKLSLLLAVPLLVCGLWGLLRPLPQQPGMLWLVSMLCIVYLGYSLAMVNYQAWGAELSADPHERTRITAVRESFGLAGVVLASLAPRLLSADLRTGMADLALLFACLLVLTAAVALLGTPAPQRSVPTVRLGIDLLAPLRQPAFRRLLAVFALSGIAAAIPASLVLFFVSDVLGAAAQAGVFLAIYFLSAGAGMPLWLWAARRFGKLPAWCAAMCLAVLVFAWAGLLGAGDSIAFAVICAASGLALGADLALPPSVLADFIARRQQGAAACFGWWNFVAKLNLALAAGLALPLLQVLHYEVGTRSPEGLHALSLIYAGVPAVLKLCAAALLWRDQHLIAEA
ncbi:MFS transporter [Uliginosibacterium sediminicola]|uniref:MFS transporter n=1 Tax=Uliginosibacterium sediminicola TaxID=2024550 RepID=A0ABU9YWP5_9RHOO